MKVLQITKIGFNGIKIMKPEEQGEKDTRSPQKIVFDNMTQAYENLRNTSDSIEVKTVREIMTDINNKAWDEKEKARNEIDQKHPLLVCIGFARKRMYKKAESKIDQMAKIEKTYAEIQGDINLDLKENLVKSMEEVLRAGREKIDEMDKLLAEGREIKGHTIKDCALKSKICPRNFESIAGYDYEKEVLHDVFISKVEEEKAGENPKVPGSILFFGPWGNGKTYITKNIAKGTDAVFVPLKAGTTKDRQNFMTKLYDVANKSSEHFKETRQRTIIFIDEADKIIGENSPVAKDFEDFIKTCSEKYHCSVFVTANEPTKLELNMQNPDVFPIRMSIDIPDEKNLKSVVEYYLKDFTNEPLNFEEITQELLKIEKETGKKYNNSQIFGLPYLLADKIDKANPTQEEIIEYIKKDFAPLLDESDISKFNKEYEKFIGENN